MRYLIYRQLIYRQDFFQVYTMFEGIVKFYNLSISKVFHKSVEYKDINAILSCKNCKVVLKYE